MKKYTTWLFAILLLVFGGLHAQAKKKTAPQLYVFGVSTSFIDSKVYITEIQELANGIIEDKGNFLSDRDIYTHQLKTYLSKEDPQERMCVVVYALDKKTIEKKFDKIKKKLGKQKNIELKMIDSTSFSFTVPVPVEE